MAAERRVDVLMTADTVGGVWTHALELAAGLASRGLRVAIATMGAPLDKAQRAQVRRLAPNALLRESAYRLEWMAQPWADLHAAGAWLQRLEAELRPAVVHLNQFAFGALPFRAPTLLVAHSCVLSWWRAVHGQPAPPAWDAYRRVVADGLAGATRVAAPTRAMLGTLRLEHGFRRNGLVLPNARHPRHFTSSAAKDAVILSAGRLWDAAKNMTALEAVAPQLPWPVRLAGSTRSPDGQVRALASGVARLGELAPEALAAELARAAIYASPARYEPFGQSALEAALSGCALVLGDIPSLREVWGPAAVYVAPDDPEALRAALRGLIDDAARRRSLAEQALARASLYTPERMVTAYLGAYAALCPDIVATAASRASGSKAGPEVACAS